MAFCLCPDQPSVSSVSWGCPGDIKVRPNWDISSVLPCDRISVLFRFGSVLLSHRQQQKDVGLSVDFDDTAESSGKRKKESRFLFTVQDFLLFCNLLWLHYWTRPSRLNLRGPEVSGAPKSGSCLTCPSVPKSTNIKM